MKLSPSGAEKWMACSGSLQLVEICPRRPSPLITLEGTAGHYWGAKCLRGGEYYPPKRPIFVEDRDGSIKAITLSEEMLKGVSCYVKALLAQGGLKGIETKIETPIPGTVDAWGEDNDLLWIWDLKTGYNPVDPEGHPQFMIYGLGLLKPHHKKVMLTVFQPTISLRPLTWLTTADELRKWGKEVLEPAIEKAKTSQELVPGSHCRYCDALVYCPAYEDFFMGKVVPAMREGLTLPLTVLKMAKPVMKYLEALEEEALRRLRNKEPVPGFKLVKGRGQRVWKASEEEVRIALGEYILEDDFYISKFISPAQAEKVAQGDYGEVIEKLVEKKHGTVLAPETDKRPAWSGGDSVEEAFGENKTLKGE